MRNSSITSNNLEIDIFNTNDLLIKVETYFYHHSGFYFADFYFQNLNAAHNVTYSFNKLENYKINILIGH